MLDTGFEIGIGEAFQLFNQLLALAVWDMLGKKQAVNEKPQLAVSKITHQVEVRPDTALFQLSGLAVRYHADRLTVFDLIAAIHEVHKVAAHGFPLHCHVIFCFQNIHDVLLTETVILITVPAEDIQDIYDNKLLYWLRHMRTAFLFISDG